MVIDDLPISETFKSYWNNCSGNFKFNSSFMLRVIWSCKLSLKEKLSYCELFIEDQLSEEFYTNNYLASDKTVGDIINLIKDLYSNNISIIYKNDPHCIFIMYEKDDDTDEWNTKYTSIVKTIEDAKQIADDYNIKNFILKKDYPESFNSEYNNIDRKEGMLVFSNGELVDCINFEYCELDRVIDNYMDIDNFEIPHPFNDFDIVKIQSNDKYGMIRWIDNDIAMQDIMMIKGPEVTVEWYYPEEKFFEHDHPIIFELDIVNYNGEDESDIPDAIQNVWKLIRQNSYLQLFNIIE